MYQIHVHTNKHNHWPRQASLFRICLVGSVAPTIRLSTGLWCRTWRSFAISFRIRYPFEFSCSVSLYVLVIVLCHPTQHHPLLFVAIKFAFILVPLNYSLSEFAISIAFNPRNIHLFMFISVIFSLHSLIARLLAFAVCMLKTILILNICNFYGVAISHRFLVPVLISTSVLAANITYEKFCNIWIRRAITMHICTFDKMLIPSSLKCKSFRFLFFWIRRNQITQSTIRIAHDSTFWMRCFLFILSIFADFAVIVPHFISCYLLCFCLFGSSESLTAKHTHTHRHTLKPFSLT